MPVNNEDAHLKTQNLREKFCDIWSPIAFLVFNVLETLRICKLMINLGIVKFFKKIIERF